MIGVAAARATARKRLVSKLGAWAAEVVLPVSSLSSPPAADEADVAEPRPDVLAIALRPPTETEMLTDERAAEGWAREWASLPALEGVEADWEQRAWRSIGRQRVPVRLRLRDADAVARFVGGGPASDWRRLRERTGHLASTFGATPELARVVRRHAASLVSFDDARFEQVLHVAAWAVANPMSGYRPRQVPVRGVDSKWLGSHRKLVTDLVGAATGSTDLGLVDSDPLVRVRVLDPGMAAEAFGGLRDVAAPVSELAAVSTAMSSLRVVFVMENLESVLAMPNWPGACAVHGSGYAVRVIGRLPWLREARVVYWGDLDSNGFAILHGLRMHLPRVESVLMDEPTLLAHRDLWVREPAPNRGVFGTLTEGELRALHALRREGDVRLEQERIPWETALETLRRFSP
ncbi:MAG: DUF2220 family protein [Dermatophilus congolensis]|nr:DUF2220 family protein [Dermatophilus congolensis]